MLEPLLNLPVTLLHGDPHSHHWQMTLFEERRLLDWHKTCLGPGICDLVAFLEQFELLYGCDQLADFCIRRSVPASEETMIDSYLLAMRAALGTQFDAHLMRQAIPAARCLFILTSWFPYFASWYEDMPDRYTWQRINRMSDAELAAQSMGQMVDYRPYLRNVFERFLRAYRLL
jgi:hypothetical protein